MGARRDLIESFMLSRTEPADRQVEALRLSYDSRILTHRLVPAEHVAVLAAVRYFCASVYSIPCNYDRWTRISRGMIRK